MIELHRGKIEKMQSFEHQHRDQRGRRRSHPQSEPPQRIERNDAGERAEQIDDPHVAGDPMGEILDPPGQGRMLPIAELPFGAERQTFGEVELEVSVEQDRNSGPHHQMQTQEPEQRAARLALRERDQAADGVRLGRAGDRLFHALRYPASGCKSNMPISSIGACVPGVAAAQAAFRSEKWTSPPKAGNRAPNGRRAGKVRVFQKHFRPRARERRCATGG
jgi:hypothetical protein